MSEFRTNVRALVYEAKDILKEAKGVFETMNELKEWNSFSEIAANAAKVNKMVVKVIAAVEIAQENIKSDFEGINSGEKLEAAVQILDDMIKLKWYLEIFDGPIIKVLITMAVDLINSLRTGEKFNPKDALSILEDDFLKDFGKIISKL